MLFSSYVFIFIFVPIVFATYFLVGRRSHEFAGYWLSLASLVFYSWWDVRFLPVLVGSILIDYVCGVLLANRLAVGTRKIVLSGAISLNLGLLVVVKYLNFLFGALNQLLMEGEISPIPFFDIPLPLGVSFFTFTQIAFLVDVYRGHTTERKFAHYLLFVSYFPHLIAGPLLHHKQIMPQFARDRTYRVNYENIAIGITVFSIGLFKKVVIADGIAIYANGIFNAVASGNTPMFFEAWAGALAYTLQLYFDFSGYCDMAIGVSLLFNINLPINFNSPYKSRNVIEFWRHWNMTLSAFLRDYLYIPLGGNRNGQLMRYRNIMITMLLGGLWHGAGWTFVLWGGLHGIYLIINHEWRRVTISGWLGFLAGRVSGIAGMLVTFTSVVFGWVLFRSENLATSLEFYQGMLGMNGISLPGGWEVSFKNLFLSNYVKFHGLITISYLNARYLILWMVVGLIIVFGFPNPQQVVGHLGFYKSKIESRVPLRSPTIYKRITMACVTGFLFYMAIVSMTKPSPFLYFQF